MLAEIFHVLLIVGVAGGSFVGLVVVHECVRCGVHIEIGKVIWLLALLLFIYANGRTGLWGIAWDFFGSVGCYGPLVFGGVVVFLLSIIEMGEVQARWVAKQRTALDPEVGELRTVVKKMKMKMDELQ